MSKFVKIIMYNFHNSYYVNIFAVCLTFKKLFFMSFRYALRLCKALGFSNCLSFNGNRVRVFFVFNGVVINSNYVTFAYARKYYPLIMGENAFRYIQTVSPL